MSMFMFLHRYVDVSADVLRLKRSIHVLFTFNHALLNPFRTRTVFLKISGVYLQVLYMWTQMMAFLSLSPDVCVCVCEYVRERTLYRLANTVLIICNTQKQTSNICGMLPRSVSPWGSSMLLLRALFFLTANA